MYIQSVLVFIRTFWSRASIRRAPRVVAAIVINVDGVKKVQFVRNIYHIENSVIIYILIFQRVCVCTTKKLEHP